MFIYMVMNVYYKVMNLLESKEPSYYLNSDLKPYGCDVEIIQNDFEFYTKENGLTHCFVAKIKKIKKGYQLTQ